LAVGLVSPLLFVAAGDHGVIYRIPQPVVEIRDLPAYEIPVYDLSAGQLAGVRGVSGVTEVRQGAGGAVIVFQPCGKRPWEERYRWQKGAEQLLKQAPFRAAFETMSVKDCRLTGPRADAAFPEPLATFNVTITFRNRAQLLLCGYAGAEPGVIEHEMMRDFIGARMWTRSLGGGTALVARVPAGDIAVWKVSRQLFARLEGRYDEALLAACVRRFGSQTQARSGFSAQRWASVEIGLRIQQLERAAEWERKGKGEFVWRFAPYLTDQFPDLFSRFGMIDLCDPPGKTQRWLRDVRKFLLSNRMHFRYDPDAWGFVLLGGSRSGMRAPPIVPVQYRDPKIYGKM